MNETEPTSNPASEQLGELRTVQTEQVAPPPRVLSQDTFAWKLKTAREAAGLSQTKLAALVKVSSQSIGNWENARSEPSPQKQGAVLRKLRELVKSDAEVVEGLSPSVARLDEPTADHDRQVTGEPIEEVAPESDTPDHDPYDPVPDDDRRLDEVNLLIDGDGDVREVGRKEFFESIKKPEPTPLPNIPVGNVHTTPEGVLLRRLADDDDREGYEVLDGKRWFTVGFVAPHPRAKTTTKPATPAPIPAPPLASQKPDSTPTHAPVSPKEKEPAEASPETAVAGQRSWNWWNA
jgi:DNA-binding XRE family transcriptional regulator